MKTYTNEHKLSSQPWLGGIKAIADFCGVSPRTVARWIEEGKIPVRRFSARKILARPDDVNRALNEICAQYERGVA